ncbi:MAG: fatty acid desaturase [Nodosilinea sp. WJT8-NPBG4]|jgi:fatty acid desaturase|nr:fatty acid desaturase [Nodosilinea sp. WJT8-NPBG4]
MSYVIAKKALISQATYAKKLRPLLPPEAFEPDPGKLLVLAVNALILLLGWAIAKRLNLHSVGQLGLYLPLVLVMANSVTALTFGSHELLHGSIIRRPRLAHLFSLLGFTPGWMPPTLWQIVHNRIHHNNTNTAADPDRNYLFDQPNTWCKRVQNFAVLSSEITPLGLIFGLLMSWGFYTFRNLTSVLLFNSPEVKYVPAAFAVKPKERRKIAAEFLVILLIHLGIISYLEFDVTKLIWAYFLPVGLGYAGLISYIGTNHLASPMTAVNDPLLNSLSVQVPKIFDVLHLNFSYHAEHHIFPGLNSEYYPRVRELLQRHYPERMDYVTPIQQAWHLMRSTPRLYRDETTFTDWSGTESVPCPLNLPVESSSELYSPVATNL